MTLEELHQKAQEQLQAKNFSGVLNLVEKTAKELHQKAQEQFKEKNYDDALKTLKEIEKILPDWKNAYLSEAIIYRTQRNFFQENATLQKVLYKFKLQNQKERNLASEVLYDLATSYYRLALPQEAVDNFLMSAQLAPNDVEACKALSGAIFAACYAENFSVEDFRFLYGEYQKHLPKVEPLAKNNYYVHKKIRIGFLSNTFKSDIATEWSWSLLLKLDKQLFDVYCYSKVKKADKVTNFLIETVDVWRDITELSDEAAAKMIHDDEIDILFDLTVHVRDNLLRIAAYRPAPVQISGIGYVSSTGLDCFNYFLSDVYCAGNPDYFKEKLVCLPHSHICYEPKKELKIADEPPCVANGYVTFGCFNRYGKITDSILKAWKKILDAVPDSRLLLKTRIFNTDDGKNFVRNRLERFGFDVSRVEMRPSSADYFSQYNDVDIALDTFPYTGGVTTCEALYMGVPLVSLYGERHGSRFGLSILKNIGIGNLAVSSYDDYVQMAAALAGDWELLSLWRKNLRDMMKRSPLMDSKIYIHDVEDAFIKILIDAREKVS